MFTEKEIIGIDHGNRNVKGAGTVFTSCLAKLAVKPDNLENVLEYNDCFYRIGSIPKLMKEDKTVDDEFYHLTLIALAKELKRRGKRKSIVRMAVGLPPRWYDKHMHAFRNYLFQNRELCFRFEGVLYQVSLEHVSVYMQGVAALLTLDSKELDLNGPALIVDIGCGTIDTIEILKRIPTGKGNIDDHATLKCIAGINEAVIAELGAKADDYIIEEIMKSGSYRCDKEYLSVIQRELENYAGYVHQLLQRLGYNLKLLPVIYVGGGACIMKNFASFDKAMTACNTDIHANAKGYEKTEERILRAKQGRMRSK